VTGLARFCVVSIEEKHPFPQAKIRLLEELPFDNNGNFKSKQNKGLGEFAYPQVCLPPVPPTPSSPTYKLAYPYSPTCEFAYL